MIAETTLSTGYLIVREMIELTIASQPNHHCQLSIQLKNTQMTIQ